MITHWLSLLAGLFFGLIPARLLINCECRYLRFDGVWSRIVTPLKTGQRRRRWWKMPLVWIDPVRGYIAAWMLADAFEPVNQATALERVLPVLVTFAILFVVVWLQTLGRKDEDETVSPVAFLGGMMFALLPATVALSAIAIGVATTVALNSFAAGYLVAAITTAGIGYMFLGRSLDLLVYTVIVVEPLLINWVRRTSMVMPVRC